MLLNPPPLWTNQRIVLYHGTLDADAKAIVATGVNVALGKANADFGPGFYTTTLERQARSWAWGRSRLLPGGMAAAVVQFSVDRDDLSRLETISFVRGDYDADDFWSLVTHCRSGGAGHARGVPGLASYDVAVGPVAAFWQQRSAMSGADQISFHTKAAEHVLNASLRKWWKV